MIQSKRTVIKCFENAKQFNCFQQQVMQFQMKPCHSVLSNSLQPYGLLSPRNFLGQNTVVGSLYFVQWIFPTQGSNPGLQHCRRIPYQLSHKEVQMVSLSLS